MSGEYTHFTPEKREAFLVVFRKKRNISKACRAVGISRKTAYDARDTDPIFAAEWGDINEEFADDLESEGFRRAHDGTLKPIYQGGEKVGTVREYSDTLLIFLLKGRRPEVYKDRLASEHSGPGGKPIQVALVGQALEKVYGDDGA